MENIEKAKRRECSTCAFQNTKECRNCGSDKRNWILKEQ
jgi:RNA polymerase subunit RPABC4/transcription elongation factor Spt4